MATTKFEEKNGKIGKMSYPIEDYTPPYSQSKHDLKSSYAWDGLLSRSDVLAAPVKAFRHVSKNPEKFQFLSILSILDLVDLLVLVYFDCCVYFVGFEGFVDFGFCRFWV